MKEEVYEKFCYEEMICQSKLAWKLKIDKDELWLPKSQCELDEDEKCVLVPKWLVEKKGLELEEEIEESFDDKMRMLTVDLPF